MNMVPSNTPRTMLDLLIVISTIALTDIASTQAQEFTSPPPPKGNPLSEAKITQQGALPPDYKGVFTAKKKEGKEIGGLVKGWITGNKIMQDPGQGNPPLKVKRMGVWQWLDPFAALSKEEEKAQPFEWHGRRHIPHAVGNRTSSKPEGIALFFMRF
jgi:hypothetical protein